MSKLYYKNVQYIPESTPISDSTTATDSTWSSQKINTKITEMTPVKGTDYFTDADKLAMLVAILTEIPNMEQKEW